MIRSMTGYGEAERDCAAGRLRLEVRTVNHRFFNANIKAPPGLQRHERELAEVLKRHLARGHVSASLALGPHEGDGTDLEIDLEGARRYKALLETLQSELGLEGTIDLSTLVRMGGFLSALRPSAEAEPVEAETLVDLAEEAARVVVAMREAEGAKLHEELSGRLAVMRQHLARVEARAPERLAEERDRLRRAVAELTEDTEVDEDRLAREIAYLAERWDISEEIVRLHSHLDLFQEALDGDGAEPVGKRLGFLVQEMHREANTIGSKANDAQLTHASLALKEEVEKIREQVENVE